jgi:predicted outer membrane protein
LKIILLYTIASATFLVGCNTVNKHDKVQADEGDVFLISNLYRQVLLSIKVADEALTRSTYVETKTLAEEVKTSQAKIKIDIEALAGRKGFELPFDITANQLKSWQVLVKNKGREFDKVFLQLITQLNTKEHSLLDKIATGAKDIEIKKAGKSVLANIKSKEDLAKQVQQLDEQVSNKDSIIKATNF